jgi:hypothetical protein
MKITTNNCYQVEKEMMIASKRLNDKEITLIKPHSNCSWDEIDGIQWIKMEY